MNLIALLIGLVIERLATQLFHWRRMRWMDRIIDFGFRQAERVANWPAVIPVILLGVVLVLPVFGVIWFLGDTLAGFTYLLLAVIVLFFSLGPRDVGEEVGAYCDALNDADEERVHNAAKAIVEGDVLGWSWLFPPYRWHYSARATTLVRMTAFDGKCLRDKCESDHNLGYELMKRFAGIMMERLQATRMQVMDVYH